MKAVVFPLVVLTLNVSGPRFFRSGWPARRGAIAAELRTESPDVAAFQGLRRAADLRALGDAADAAGRAQDRTLGLAVVARAPIVSSASRDLGGGWGALRARLRSDGREFDVYSVRLEPGDGSKRARRLAQLFRLAEFVREQSDGRPFVILGDLAVASDDREPALLLDLLEARDLCVAHGDEVCGRTLGDHRVDYALIPYSSAPPREPARAAFTGLPANGGALPRFGLRARLDDRFLALKPAAEPSGRAEALSLIADALAAARTDADIRATEAGWIPFLGTRAAVRAQDEAARLGAAEEEVRSALIRGSAARHVQR